MRKIAGLLCVLLMFTACGGGGSQGTGSTNSLPSTNAPQSGAPAQVAPSGSAGNAQAVTITEYSLGSTPSNGGIAIAGDGSIWTESNGQSQTATFVRWNNGKVTSYPIGFANGFSPFTSMGIVASLGSNVFALGNQNQGDGNSLQQPFEIPDAGGTITQLPNAALQSGSGVSGSIVGLSAFSNGSLWEAQSFPQDGCCSGNGLLVQVAPGTASQIQLPSGQNSLGFTYSLPTALAQGPDGNIWVSVQNWQNAGNQSVSVIGNSMLVYTSAGKLLQNVSLTASAAGMVKGPDGAMWFTLPNGQIGRMTTAGAVSYYTSKTTTGLGGITVGSDGALWFLEPTIDRLGRITTAGAATDYAIPTAASNPIGIAGPANGCQPYTLWFAEAGSGKIATVVYK